MTEGGRRIEKFQKLLDIIHGRPQNIFTEVTKIDAIYYQK
jgi:hypothetical protein